MFGFWTVKFLDYSLTPRYQICLYKCFEIKYNSNGMKKLQQPENQVPTFWKKKLFDN